MRKNIIVTGGAGFIGSNLATELSKEHDVIVIDDFSNGTFENLGEFKGRVLAKDITTIDWDREFNDNNPDIIFHQAAITDTRVKDQKKVMEVNVNAFRKLLLYCLLKKIKLIYASSAAVYGRNEIPMAEDDKLQPLNIYGFSKVMMDRWALSYIKNKPTSHIIGLRYFNVYGQNEYHKGQYASMIWQLYTQMEEGLRPMIFTDGDQCRDHVYVKDVVQANIKMIDYNGSGIFNVGSGVATSFNRLVDILNQVLKTKLRPNYMVNRYDFYQEKTLADITKIQKAVKYKPKYTLLEGIKDYVGEKE